MRCSRAAWEERGWASGISRRRGQPTRSFAALTWTKSRLAHTDA